MRVIVVERGERPTVLTKARTITPQAAKWFADRLEQQNFAHQASIVVDWTGDYHWQGDGEMPPELALPAMYIVCERWFPQINEWLKVDIALDIESMFGRDDAKSDDLEEVGRQLAEKIRTEMTRKGLN